MLDRKDGKLVLAGGRDASKLGGLVEAVYGRIANGVSSEGLLGRLVRGAHTVGQLVDDVRARAAQRLT
jgi:hypothetical protein